MGIQGSINSLLSQAQSLATFYRGFKKADDIIKDTTTTKNEAQIQTDIASGNAPLTEDGKVDPEWIQKRRDEYNKKCFNDDGLTEYGKSLARFTDERVKRGDRPILINAKFYNDSRVQEYLKSFAPYSELKNEVAGKVARASVDARTASINQTKSAFDEHTASLIRYYGKGSGNP